MSALALEADVALRQGQHRLWAKSGSRGLMSSWIDGLGFTVELIGLVGRKALLLEAKHRSVQAIKSQIFDVAEACL